MLWIALSFWSHLLSKTRDNIPKCWLLSSIGSLFIIGFCGFKCHLFRSEVSSLLVTETQFNYQKQKWEFMDSQNREVRSRNDRSWASVLPQHVASLPWSLESVFCCPNHFLTLIRLRPHGGKNKQNENPIA